MINFKNYLRDTSGNFTVVMAVGMTAVAVAAGAAVEISNMTKMKNVLQSQVDIATLAAASTKAENGQQPDYATITYSNMTGNGYSEENSPPTIISNGGHLDVTATIEYTGLFTDLFGGKTYQVSASAQATLPSGGKMEVVFALDNTDSMGRSGKMGALKIGAGRLIDAIEDSNSGSNVALVPFARYINIGDASGTWLDTPDEYDTQRTIQQATHSCQSITYEQAVETRDGQQYAFEREVCNGQTTTYEAQNQIIESRYEGCIGTSEEPRHLDPISATNRAMGILNVVPHEVSGTRQDTKSHCPQAIHPLSDDYEEMGYQINGMYPVDVTYIPAGLLWAERLLDRTVVFSQPPREEGVRQAVVLMSDGKNTAEIQTDADIYSEYEISTPPYIWANFSALNPSVDNTNADTQLLCDRIKSKGVEIFTISFQVDDADAITLLENCATSPSHAYEAGSNDELISSFEQIGDGLASNVRLTQ